MSHDEFMKRINKTLYFGNDFTDNDDDNIPHTTMEMSKPLAEYASELFSDSHRGYTLNRLSCVEASSVQTATPATLIMALIYLDRLNVTDPGYVRRITPQELFIVSMMISTKFYVGHDEEIYMSDWAEYGNISEDNLKQLELKFLCAIDWNIYISNEQFFEKLTSIEKTLARRQGLRRGWLTYSELIQMLPSFALAKFLLSNITVIAVSYAASVMTIAGALFLAAQIPGTSLHRQRTQLTTNNTDLLNDADVDVGNVNVNGSTVSAATSVVITRQHNHTNLALNVEDELLKLERQYREEALRDSLLQKNNEISTESRLTLPQQMLMAKINVNQKCAKHGKQYQQQGQWFAHKEEYSDYGKLSAEAQQHYDMDLYRQPLLMQTRHDYATKGIHSGGFKQESTHHLTSYDNSTMVGLLWHYLADSVQHTTFMRLPFVWLKFM
ncbi:protein CNPPD1 isoform X2 [Calliphora vicina]